jgi:hypothetical protein
MRQAFLLPAGFNIKVSLVKNPSTASGYIDGGTILAQGSLENYDFKQY